MTKPNHRQDVKDLAGNSIIYAVGVFGVKAIAFLLLPLYTRLLSPEDFGVLAVTGAVTSLLIILMSLGLHGSVPYLFFKGDAEPVRRSNLGAVCVAMLFVATVLTLMLDNFGRPLGALLFREIAFDPYLRLAVWIAFLTSFSLIPLSLLQVEKSPGRYVLISVGGAVLAAGLMLWQVAFLNAGVRGYLSGMLLAGILMMAPYWAVLRSRIQLNPDTHRMRAALVYSLPLLPHEIAGWLLELSDRVILQHYVSLRELGLYSLGYTLSTSVYLGAVAFNSAWIPFVFKRVNEKGDEARLSLGSLATYFTVVVVWAGLGLVLLSEVVLAIFTTAPFYGAARVMPWLILGMVAHGLFFVPVGVLLAKQKTLLIAVTTVTASLVNVGTNFLLIPRLGILGAALATLLSYSLMLILAWAFAQRVFSVPYEYRRLTILGALTLTLALAGNMVPAGTSEFAVTTIKGSLWLAFPAVLWFAGFFRAPEKARFRSLALQAARYLHLK